MNRATQRTRMICLIGIDGSGKTTHAQKILLRLRKCGKKCKYVWFGTPYFFSYPFMALCRVLSLTEVHHLLDEVTSSEHKYYKNKPIALIWPWVQFLDLAIFVILKIYMPLWHGFIVVCDRFIYDVLVALMVDIGDERLHKKLVGLLMLKLEPNLNVVFLLDANETVAFRRKHDLSNLNYLIRRRRNYHLIANQLHIPIVNAELPFSLVHKELIKQLNCACR